MHVTKIFMYNAKSLNCKTPETDNKNVDKSSVSCKM